MGPENGKIPIFSPHLLKFFAAKTSLGCPGDIP